jgi:hypothetical protein
MQIYKFTFNINLNANIFFEESRVWLHFSVNIVDGRLFDGDGVVVNFLSSG